MQITELMAYEFGLVEGDIDCLDERKLKSAIPTGQSFSQFKDKIKQGHLVLLSDSPSIPLFLKNSSFGSKGWTLNNQVQHNFESTAQSAFLNRTKMSGSSSGGGYRSKNLSPPLPIAPYIPQPVRPAPSDTPPTLKYEYCFDIASCHESFHRNAGCMFALTKTENEALLGRWNESKTEHGTRYTLHTAYNEPKRLIGQIANIPLGISIKEPIRLRNIGTQVANEGFIPVSPAVQLGERLGFPTEGFYYHFHNNELIQEYRILGDKSWSFYATKSMQHRLDPERGYNNDQAAILVYWKIGGKMVDNQHLVYLDRQITRDELDSLNDDWLTQNGVKLDIPALLEATKQPIAPRTISKEDQAPNKPKFHVVQMDNDTGKRETWDKIAKQYGLTPLELLNLNPSYKKDPMSLIVGHSLNVEKAKPVEDKEPITELPPVSPKAINQPANTYYNYSEHLINGSTVKAINSEQSVEKDIPVLNLKTLVPHSQATDYGKTALLTFPMGATATNLGVISSNTTKTMGTWSLSGEAVASFARMGGFLAAALWPSQLGDSTLDAHPELSSVDTTTMRVRFNMYTDENGKQQVVGIKTGEGSAYGERVTKRRAIQQGQSFVADLDNGITITWTPDGSTDIIQPDTVYPEQDQLDIHNIWVRPIEEHEQEIGTILYPETDLVEYIITFPADAGLPPLYLVFSKKAYSAGFKTKLSPNSYPGVSRARHFQEANENLLNKMETDADFKKQMALLDINLTRTVTGLAPRRPPEGWTWHHERGEGEMVLVPRSHHTIGSDEWKILHPENKGGYSIWGKK
jgi:hypothetical protein